MKLAAGVVMAVALAAAGDAEAATRLFAYDPANAATREAAGGLTFEFRQRLVFNTILKLHSTLGRAQAELAPVDEKVLGGGGLSRLIGQDAPERDLYEVSPADEGEALIAAFCPGSKRGFMSFGRLKANRPLRVHVLGDNPAGGPARLCRTLDFSFRGEWKLPPGAAPGARDLKTPSFPH